MKEDLKRGEEIWYSSSFQAEKHFNQLQQLCELFVFSKVPHCQLILPSHENCLWDMYTGLCGHLHSSLTTWSTLLTSQGHFWILQLCLTCAVLRHPSWRSVFSTSCALSPSPKSSLLTSSTAEGPPTLNHRNTCPELKIYIRNHRAIFPLPFSITCFRAPMLSCICTCTSTRQG